MKPGSIFLLFAILGLASCLSTAGLQSGRSIGVRKGYLTPYISSGGLTLADKDDSEEYPTFLPSFGAQFGVGITDRLDLGMRIDLGFFASLQAKYQILGDQRSAWAVSIGAETGVNIATLFGVPFYYYTLPVFVSYHPTERFYVYGIPRYAFGQRYVREADRKKYTSNDFLQTQRQSGFAYGFAVGNKSRFSLEIGHFGYQLYKPTQLAIGFTGIFGK
jgi:hypothetical protein